MLIFSLLKQNETDVFLLSNLSMKGLRPALQIKTWGWKAGCEVAMCTHSPRSQLYSGLHQEKGGQQIKGGQPHPHEIPPVVLFPHVESSTSLQHGTVVLDTEEKWSTKMVSLEHVPWGDRLKDLGLSSQEKWRIQGDVRAAFQHLKGAYRKDFLAGPVAMGHGIGALN